VPVLHLIHGYLGVGKSTFARALAERTGALRLSPDEVLVQRHGPTPPEDEYGLLERDIKVEMWRQAEAALARGQDVVMDFGFWKREERDAARAVAKRLGVDAVLYDVRCDMALARQRVLKRSQQPGQLMIDGAAFDGLLNRLEPLGGDEAATVVKG
jgi:predicted kinase